MSRYLVDQIEHNEKVKVCRHTEVVELHEDTKTGERTTHPAKARMRQGPRPPATATPGLT